MRHKLKELQKRLDLSKKGFAIIFFFFFLVSWIPLSQGNVEAPKITSLSGHATLIWVQKKKTYRLDQIVQIDTSRGWDHPEASFETLDDFGNTLLKINFSKRLVFKKFISFPITSSELIAFLLYQTPQGKAPFETIYDSKGLLTSVEKRSKSKKKAVSYRIFFRDLKKMGKIFYPQKIEFVSKKTTLILIWQDVQISF